MNALAILFAVGIALLAVEVFLPGGIAGIFGGLSMLGGCVLAFQQFGVSGGSVATVVALGLLGLTIYIELVWLPKSKLGRAMVVESAVDGTSQMALPPAKEVVGQSAEALTTLAPSGYISLGGKRYEAFSRSGHVEKGAALRVVGVDNFRLIVTKT
jgi:membrane-bound ClpP family serine protease